MIDPNHPPFHPSDELGTGPLSYDALRVRLARLQTDHELLLRYARDLKQAYEAERDHHARLAQSTLALVSMLGGAHPRPESHAA
ncbi:MAG: hypothetical protein U0821_14080 [Chloroflexota bacterium]